MTGIELNYILKIAIYILSTILLAFICLSLQIHRPPEKYIGESMTSWERRIDEDYVDFKKNRHDCRIMALILMVITATVVTSKYNIHTVRTEPVKWKAVYENNIGANTTIDDLWNRSVSPTTDLTYDDIDILGDVQTAEITAKNDTDSTTKKVTVLKSANVSEITESVHTIYDNKDNAKVVYQNLDYTYEGGAESKGNLRSVLAGLTEQRNKLTVTKGTESISKTIDEDEIVGDKNGIVTKIEYGTRKHTYSPLGLPVLTTEKSFVKVHLKPKNPQDRKAIENLLNGKN